MQETVTVRLPKAVHYKAKLAAHHAGMSLQDWISSVANKAIAEGGNKVERPVPFAHAYSKLPLRLRQSVAEFVELLTLMSADSQRNGVQHIAALVRILRRCNPQVLREFEQL